MQNEIAHSHTVETLRKSGYKVRVTHFRPYRVVFFYPDKKRFQRVGTIMFGRETLKSALENPFYILSESPISSGGITKVDITTPDGRNSSAQTVCSKKDAFNRKRGVTVALQRALKDLFV